MTSVTASGCCDARRGFRQLQSPRWRSASAPTPPSSASSTRCCCGRCPTRDADRLAVVWEHNLPRDRKNNVVSPGNFIHWREMNQAFEDIAAVGLTFNMTLTGAGDPAEIAGPVRVGQFLPGPRRQRRRSGAPSPPRRIGRAARVGRHQRSAVAAAVRRRSRRSSIARITLERRAIQRRRRDAAGVLDSWTVQSMSGCRSASRPRRGRRADAGSWSSDASARRDDRRRRSDDMARVHAELDQRCSRTSTPAGRRASCRCASS